MKRQVTRKTREKKPVGKKISRKTLTGTGPPKERTLTGGNEESMMLGLAEECREMCVEAHGQVSLMPLCQSGAEGD